MRVIKILTIVGILTCAWSPIGWAQTTDTYEKSWATMQKLCAGFTFRREWFWPFQYYEITPSNPISYTRQSHAGVAKALEAADRFSCAEKPETFAKRTFDKELEFIDRKLLPFYKVWINGDLADLRAHCQWPHTFCRVKSVDKCIDSVRNVEGGVKVDKKALEDRKSRILAQCSAAPSLSGNPPADDGAGASR